MVEEDGQDVNHSSINTGNLGYANDIIEIVDDKTGEIKENTNEGEEEIIGLSATERVSKVAIKNRVDEVTQSSDLGEEDVLLNYIVTRSGRISKPYD